MNPNIVNALSAIAILSAAPALSTFNASEAGTHRSGVSPMQSALIQPAHGAYLN